ncbi:MAG: V-type ATPase subunit [Planctomycetota bacterium]
MPEATMKAEVRDRAAWTYVSGLASALEARLLPQRATLDLLGAGSLDELLQRLRQSILFAELPDATAPFELANAMDAAFADSLRSFRDASPTTAVADVFLLDFEWRAFRCYLRSQAVEHAPVGVPGAETPEAVWERCWTTTDVEPGLRFYAAAADSVREKMPREQHDERLVDEITDIYRTRHITEVVGRIGSPLVADWVTTWLKLHLGLELLRCSLLGWPHVRVADALDDFGVGKDDIMGLATPERQDWRTPFLHLGLPAVESIGENEQRPTVVLDRLIDDRLTARVREGRGVPFGPEPVAAFLWGLRVEWTNLKLIATGLAAGLPRETIAEDVRQSYV